MGQRVLSVIISDTPPVGAKGSLWIKYVRKTNSYQIMLPVPNGWLAAGPTNDFVNQIIDRALNPYPDVDDGSGSGSTGGAFNSSFNQSYEILGNGDDPRVEATANKTQTISAESTEKQYPSAKAVYEYIQQALQNPSDFNDDFNDDFGGGAGGSVDLSDVIKYTEQTPTTAQQAIARKNVGVNQIVDLSNVHEDPTPFLPGVIYYFPKSLCANFTDSDFAKSSNPSESNHYYFKMDTTGAVPIMTWPSSIVWVNNEPPVFTTYKHYEISIMDGVGMWIESPIPVSDGGGDDPIVPVH